MAIVVFDVDRFIILYPEFSAVNPIRLTAFFDEACIYLDNSDCSIVSDIKTRTIWFNWLVAHIATVRGALSADGQARPFGRILTATEGSVSVSFGGPPPTSGSAEWFLQTQYGSDFWAATASLRGFHYIPQPTRY